ncbi:hypothetical protein ALC53_09572 [Atta colombica]|uniref:Uncharacterized protein n=1 Tax=Atta colombica TaxID=520822 RepID=A0A195B6B3_9HYME|nr:hypothetical protein ALC53_09572 [Atta colombica]
MKDERQGRKQVTRERERKRQGENDRKIEDRDGIGSQSGINQHKTYERRENGIDASYKREQGTEQRVNPEEESNGEYGSATRTECEETQTNQKR